MTIQEVIEQIYDTVSEEIEDVEKDDIRSRVEEFDGYGLPEDEVVQTVTREIAREHDMEPSDFQTNQSNEEHTVSEAKELGEEEWLTLTVSFDEEWDPAHEEMTQQGLLGDETGRIKFTAWSNSNVPSLEEGKSYKIRNVVTETYQGNTNIKFTSNTEIEELDEEIEVNTGGEEVEVEGAFVAMQNGSGLIKRCPEEGCTRVLQNGRCSEHGDVDGEFDLRIKGVLDDGDEVYEVIIDKETTEEITGIEFEEAREMAMDALNSEVVAKEMRNILIGRYYRVKGGKAGRYILVDEIEQITETPDVESLLVKARGM